MWTRVDFKRNGRMAFTRNYWICVLVSMVAGMLGGNIVGSSSVSFSSSDVDFYTQDYDLSDIISSFMTPLMFSILCTAMVFGVVLTILVSNVIMVGSCRFFMENRACQASFDALFYGFRQGRYGSVAGVMGIRYLKQILWTLLFIIPGIIKAYEYLMIPYIIAENPETDRKRVFEMSRQMMDGHKMEAFIMQLSFLPWSILGAFTCGLLNMLYTNPYINASFAEFYTARKSEAIAKGYIMPQELTGVNGNETC